MEPILVRMKITKITKVKVKATPVKQVIMLKLKVIRL